MLNPRLGLGEAYMDGSVSVDGDNIMGLVELVRRNNPWEKGGEIGDSGMLKRLASQLMRPLRQMNNVEPLWICSKIANDRKQLLAWNIGIKRRANVN